MARNSSGVYSLPIGAFSPGGLIKASDHNSNYSDIATALTQSLATTGVTAMTGQLPAAAGTVGAPGYTFTGDLTTGFYRSGTHAIAWSNNGSQSGIFNADGSVTFNGAVSVGTTLAVTGVATFMAVPVFSAGLGAVSGTTGVFTGLVTPQVGLLLPEISTPAAPAAGNVAVYSKTGDFLAFENPAGKEFLLGKDPTYTELTSGSAATYTPPVGAIRFEIEMIGSGAGGGAQATNSGTIGNDTSFQGVAGGFTAWTAKGGTGGVPGGTVTIGGAGGTGGVDGTGTKIARTPGQAGGPTQVGSAQAQCASGYGGNSILGPGAGGHTDTRAGTSAAANTGGGGAGGGTINSVMAAGGGGGEYVKFTLTLAQMGATATYTIGASAAGGTAGTQAGGAGGSGVIRIKEYYN